MASLNQLSATEAVKKLAAREITAVALLRDCLERITAREPAVHAWTCVDAESAMRRARALDAQGPTGLLHGLPIAVKDLFDTVRPADRLRLADLCRSSAGRGRGERCAGASRRRHRRRQDGHDGVRDVPSWADVQPSRPEAHARRIVVRLGRRRGGSDGAARVRHADGWIHRPTGGVLRRRWIQADIRHDQPRRREDDLRHARYRRRAGADRAGCRTLRGGVERPTRAFDRAAASGYPAGGPLPDLRVGTGAPGNGRRVRGCRAAIKGSRRERS